MDMGLKFDNYMNLKLLRRVITAETADADFGEFTSLSFLLVLRSPTDALPARRAPLTIRLGAKALRADNSMLGLQKLHGGSTRLILKLNKRKNFRSSPPLMRPRFCGSAHFVSSRLCPVRDFWPLFFGCHPRGFIIPSRQGANLDRILKSLLTSLGVGDSVRYSAHCCRRGDAMELLNFGASLSVIVKTDGRNSAEFRSYLQFRLAEESDMRLALLQIRDIAQSESGAEQTSDIARSAASPCRPLEEDTSSISPTISGAVRYARG